MNETETKQNSAAENIQNETGKPKAQDAFKLVSDNLFFWLGYNQFTDKVTGKVSEPKKGVTIGNLNTKKYVNFPATRSFYVKFREHMVNDILPAMEKFCDLDDADANVPRIVNNL